ncbi:MAG: GNAT family protein [Ignavibacteriaceae bacterium]
MVNADVGIKTAVPQDAEELFSLVESCRQYLREWLPWVDGTRSVNDTLMFIIESKGKNMFNGREVYTVRYKNTITGMIDLHNGDSFNRKADIGYWLAEQYQGKGIITSACKILIDKAFYEKDINRVTIKAAENNIKSQRIPERLGFKKEGTERQGEYLNGSYIDLAVYSMLKNEWKTVG